ncbi:MAG: glycosyltransferase [Coriobacteriia bacterium]|nr:glycosyltransferase [Coriobacteriia bacterium]
MAESSFPKIDRPLHVLHLPINIRWIMDNMIVGQKEVGIDVKKLLISPQGVDNWEQERIDYIPVRNPVNRLKGYPLYIKQTYQYFRYYFKLIKWADIVHWQYSQRCWHRYGIFKDIDFFLLRLLNKPVVAQFHGMDFLNNIKWSESNPWWMESFDSDRMDEFNILAETTQREFAEAGNFFAMGYGMLPSVEEKNKNRAFLMERSVDVSAIEPRVDYAKRERVVIVHGPSSPQKKGTKYVLQAIEEIKKIRDIEFKLLTDMTHEEVLDGMRGADIAIDQLLCGDYGVFSVEAMASGVAVVANVCPELQEAYPHDLPIMSATPLTIKDVLLYLIDDSEERTLRAKRGPEYAYKVHSIEATTPEILRVYKAVAQKKGQSKTVERIEYHLEKCKKIGWHGISDEEK